MMEQVNNGLLFCFFLTLRCLIKEYYSYKEFKNFKKIYPNEDFKIYINYKKAKKYNIIKPRNNQIDKEI